MESAAPRINFSQSFNGLAWVIGPLIGLYICENQGAAPGEKLTSMILPFASIGFALFMIGRMSGSYIMSRVKPARILAINAGLSILLLPVVSMNLGWISLIALYTVFLLISIIFPTIFTLGIKDLGPQTKKGASIIVMAVVGGAVFPSVMVHISDLHSTSVGFLAPIALFMLILYYAFIWTSHNGR